ncbi:PEP-CTERM sorting domain-containing protein, partial [Roseateles sp. GG27B]
ATQAQAALVLGWDFENAAANQISGIAASTTTAGFSAASFNTGNNGVVNFGGTIGNLSLTRFFGTTNYPSLTFALSSSFVGTLSFDQYHNNNVGYPTYPQYGFDVQLSNDGGINWSNIATNIIASSATNNSLTTISGISLGSGTHSVRWVGEFAAGGDSNTEYFGLDNVNFNNIPEPSTTALIALALLCGAFCRRRSA